MFVHRCVRSGARLGLPTCVACLLVMVLCGGRHVAAQEGPQSLESFDTLAQWQVSWTGHAAGRAEAVDGRLLLEPHWDAKLDRKGHSRLTMTRLFEETRDFSSFTGIRLRLRVLKPVATSLWLHLLEEKGVRYRCDTYAKMSLVGEWQTLLTRFDTDFRWDFESAVDADQSLGLSQVAGLRLMMSVPEGTDGSMEIADISLYAEPPPAAANLIWTKIEGGVINLLAPGAPLPAPVSVTVTGGKLEQSVRKPRLQWSAVDAWKAPIAEGAVSLALSRDHTAPARIELAVPGYAELALRLLDGEEELRSRKVCIGALPRPAPEDAEPREDSIFGIWPGGYGAWIKLGAKWARTYCQPWDFEPSPEGGFAHIARDKEGNPRPYAGHVQPELNYTCFFRGIPKWLSSRADRADHRKFPPTDWDEWARFVSHYVGLMKDRIRVWEVWNEPVPYAYWMGTMEEVVKLHEVTYRAIKRAQPESVVLGPCPYRIRLPFTERFFELGGGEWIDAVLVHAYCSSPDPHLIEDIRWLKQLMAKHGLNMDIWITEIGWSTRRHSELLQASYLVQTYVIGLSEGVRTIIWHMNWDYDDKMLRGGHGLLRHNHQPKPGLVAYGTLIRMLEGARFVEEVAVSEPARVFLFEKRGQRAWVAWARGGAAEWKLPVARARAFNMMGAPLSADSDGRVSLSDSPVYVLEMP